MWLYFKILTYKEFKNYYELESFFEKKELFLFAYGSLMWDPCFFFYKKQVCTISGYVRNFCIYSSIYRGTKNFPGLVLGLKKQHYPKNNTCTGLLFSLSKSQKQEGLKKIWGREMIFDVYIPTVLLVQEQNMLTFVANKKSKNFCQLSPEKKSFIIKNAIGSRGSCLEYFENTRKMLEQFGLQDCRLKNLL